MAALVPDVLPLRSRVAALIAGAGTGVDVGVAVRALDGRAELLVNEDLPFHAASTIKVPVMIELFRQADGGLLALDDRLPIVNRFFSVVDGSPYSLSADDDSDGGALYRRTGQTMTLRELCEAMITVSSNLATNLLIERVGIRRVQAAMEAVAGTRQTFVRRGVEDRKAFDRGIVNETTALDLVRVFEALALGRAASPGATAEMIGILQRQRFNEGIPAGLPPSTVVAHKTGRITRIHHDAGIVYSPRPYAIAVLVRGIDDERISAALMADLSRMVYEGLW